ncbi:MAG: type VI secretion system baseplate subunit TssE [Spirochaetaceae bacterium]|jgi:type VI secretion system lysozyme-like protein|nr:type VI secretion system baseplate subunit TssE [Spirochaetaceae bacterium]
MENVSAEHKNFRKEDARYKPYVFKRLTDLEPHEKTERIQNVITEKQVKEDIFKNIEMLFASRSHPSLKELKGYEDLEDSVLGYGISDYCGKINSDISRETLLEHIRKQIKVFEPRLAPDSVRVDFANPEASMRSLLELRISGVVTASQVNEEVVFISHLDLETGSTSLSYVG